MSEHKNNGRIEIENKGKKIIVMPLDDNSKEISQVLANDTARKILSLLSERSMTLTEICAELTGFKMYMFKFIRMYYLKKFDKFISEV